MNYLPRRRKRAPMNVQPPDKVVCQGHDKYVRGFECALLGKEGIGPLGTSVGKHTCEGRMEAHHSTTRGAGGGDETLVPLCARGHRNIHDGVSFNVDFVSIAHRLWKGSPHRIKFEREWLETWGDAPLPYRRALAATAPIAGRQDDEMESGDEAQIKDRP